MGLPRIVFVKEYTDRYGDVLLIAGSTIEEVSPDELNAPEMVGTYVLKEKRRLVKRVLPVGAK